MVSILLYRFSRPSSVLGGKYSKLMNGSSLLLPSIFSEIFMTFPIAHGADLSLSDLCLAVVCAGSAPAGQAFSPLHAGHGQPEDKGGSTQIRIRDVLVKERVVIRSKPCATREMMPTCT